jgi:hypothetical protein
MTRNQIAKAQKTLDKIEEDMLKAIDDRVPANEGAGLSDRTFYAICENLETEAESLKESFEKIREHLENQL